MNAFGVRAKLTPLSPIAVTAAVGIGVLIALSPAPAAAQAQAQAQAQEKVVDEVKIGVLGHDVGFLTHHVEAGADVNLEMLFTPPDFLSVIGSPRPHIGADINTAGHTSDGYFGLTWGITLIQSLFGWDNGVFANGSLGGAIQDGHINSAPPGDKRLGSRILFRESAELGLQINPTLSVSAILDHISNANLGVHNAGITSAGARLGVKF